MTRDVAIALAPPPSRLDRAIRSRVLEPLRALTGGAIVVEDRDETFALGSADCADALHAHIRVNDHGFYRAIAANGSVGAAEAFMEGLWETDDLVALVRLVVRNRDRLDAMERGAARIGGWLMSAWAALRRNTAAGARRNIAAHYDLGNAFFALFLDDNLMYSSALFADEHEPLEAASTRKLDRICDKLALSPATHVCEIGTGWGGFALHAARTRGCRVTTTTISREQYEHARARVAEAGLGDRIDVLADDYRALEGTFDRVVSIEMIEAIGHQYLDTYFAKIGALLRDDGIALIQAITIEGHRYAQALGSVDFIKRHIFPGSFIPSIAAISGAIARASDMQPIHLEDFGASYALTLRAWRQRFLARRTDAAALGYDERFLRMWEFYLAYCEGGFLERSTGVAHITLARPRARVRNIVTSGVTL
jgi:cyclopropane-fatty-acyl-phospholipid synthase